MDPLLCIALGIVILLGVWLIKEATDALARRYFPCSTVGFGAHWPTFNDDKATCEKCPATWTCEYHSSIIGDGDPLRNWVRDK